MSLISRRIPSGTTTLEYHVSPADSDLTPVVFLHPWFGSWPFWTGAMAALGDRTTFAVDFYSLGKGRWEGSASPEGLAQAVLDMLDAEELDQVDLVGNSVGGIVSQVIAARHPERIRQLVLIGTGANTVGALPDFAAAVDRWAQDISAGLTPRRETVEDTVELLFSARPASLEWETYVEQVLRAEPAFLAAVLLEARKLDLVPELPNITAPTLIIRGSEDRARSARHSEVLAAGMPEARPVELADAGHSPMVDHPVEFLQLLTQHLNATPEVGAEKVRVP